MRIDETYIPDMNQRLTVYRRMAAVRSEQDLDRIMDEVRDRYGPPPDSVLNLAEYASIRLIADRIGVESLDREGPDRRPKVQARTRSWTRPGSSASSRRGATMTPLPPATLKLDLRGRPKGGRGSAQKRAGDPVAGGVLVGGPGHGRRGAPGLPRDEILRPAKEDPRAEGGCSSGRGVAAS